MTGIKGQNSVGNKARGVLRSVVLWAASGVMWPAVADQAPVPPPPRSSADAFIDVWALRQDASALPGFQPESYDACVSVRRRPACMRKQARLEQIRQQAIDRFNARWLPALLRGMVKGDLVAETILRLCETMPSLQRQGIAADCSPSAEDSAFALQRLRDIGFQPAIHATAQARGALRADRLSGCPTGDTEAARRCEYLARTDRLRAILDSMRSGNLSTAVGWNICPVRDPDPALDLILQECFQLNLMKFAVAAQATRFYATGPVVQPVSGADALTLVRPPMAGQPATHPYAGLSEGGRKITRNDFSEFSDPLATQRFYQDLQAFLDGMQARIEADLRRDPRWAVFLIERVNGGLVDARIATGLR